MTKVPDVIAVNRKRRVAMLENGDLIEVTHWLDCEGEFCDADEAVVCVAGSEALGWWTIDLSHFSGKPN